MARIFFTVFISLLIALFEISLVWSLPYPINTISLIIPSLVFLIILERKRRTWAFILSAGIIFDVFSFVPLGLHVLIFALIYLVGQYLYYNYLPSHSIFSVLPLGTAMIVIYKIVDHVISLYSYGLNEILNNQEIGVSGLAAMINIAALIIMFSAFKLFIRIFKPRKLSYEKI